MPKFAANLTMLFTEAPFAERFALAAEAGFKGVEYLFPYDFDKAALRQALDDNGLEQVLHNLPAGDWAAGERGIAILPDRTEEFRHGVALAADYAAALGCAQVNCLSGIVPEGVDAAILRATFVENLAYAAAELSRHGIRLLIEPINRFDIPGFYLNTVEQAAGIIREVGGDNLFIQYDLYHQQRTGGELLGTFERHRGDIAHIQLADNPGRHEPGTGEIAWPFVFARLAALGYDGWIGCEYKPRTTTAEGLGWFAGADRRDSGADIIEMRN
ncbi:hydroxypyruvate isomerase [Shinella daejeonensis]|uniref:hydroxypyruvate isomerase n=1 Tax=Shinella daejeonensis TaxID=659017 RepID=UPI0020C79A88|nr:hydroxypyruvate isomerase [Shinella daejeonensis]MCP8896601.1 hydroxypyruvate isomerase [Shinella daejeonensis]